MAIGHSLAVKYRPQKFEDVVEQEMVIDIVQRMCEAESLPNRNFLFIGPAGCGKAQPLYSKVLTPNGFITMEEVQVGSQVITHSGARALVSGVYPQGLRPIFAIKLSDGSEIHVADNHLNLVRVDTQETVITTDSLLSCFAGGHTLDIPKADLSKWEFDVPNYSEYREITDVVYIGKEECQCIMVDHPDHTYISDGFIPTHNTTSARIIANVLNEGQGSPIEIDAASHSSVEDVRSIIQQASQYPIGMKYKVFIIDECHSLSNTAWQALLKTLEEQPARTIFIFATTNPEKIPATILSRVQSFKISKISAQGIYNRLEYVIQCESKEGRNITYTPEALSYLSRLANGGMRDALTSLDKVLAYTQDITSESIVQALDLPDYDTYFELLNCLVKKDNAQITKIVDEVYNSGTNFIKWFEAFHGFLCNIIKYVYLKDINLTMIPSHYSSKLTNYTESHAILCLKLSTVVINLVKDLKETQYLQETALTYLLSAKK